MVLFFNVDGFLWLAYLLCFVCGSWFFWMVGCRQLVDLYLLLPPPPPSRGGNLAFFLQLQWRQKKRKKCAHLSPPAAAATPLLTTLKVCTSKEGGEAGRLPEQRHTSSWLSKSNKKHASSKRATSRALACALRTFYRYWDSYARFMYKSERRHAAESCGKDMGKNSRRMHLNAVESRWSGR